MDKLKEENKELQMKIVQLETEIKNNKVRIRLSYDSLFKRFDRKKERELKDRIGLL